jgi:hypothetical protein
VSDPRTYFAVVNDLDYVTLMHAPGRHHAALWLTREEADDHRKALEGIPMNAGTHYRTVEVKVTWQD